MAAVTSSCSLTTFVGHSVQPVQSSNDRTTFQSAGFIARQKSLQSKTSKTCHVSALHWREHPDSNPPVTSSQTPLFSSSVVAALASFLVTSLPAQALETKISVDSVNPLLLFGGIGALIIPGTIFFLLGRKGYSGDLKAQEALDLLGEENVILLDIRSKGDRKEVGSPSLKSVKKKAVLVEFEKEEEDGTFFADPEFADSVTSSKGVSTDATIIVIDKLGGIAPNAAKVLTKAGFKKVYAIKGGAEGTGGWKESDLPWEQPAPAFKLDIRTIRDAIAASVEESKGFVPASLGVAAAAGASIVLLSEVEAAMQLLGTAAIVQLTLKKFLFAEDRKKTIADIRTFLDTKVAPKDLVDDIKDIGASLLPDSAIAKRVGEVADEVADAIASGEIPIENGASSVEPRVQTSSIDFPPPPRPLSPYTMYPDLKPPSSPTPSPP